MAESFDIAVLIGSLRKESWNRKAFNALTAIAPASCSFREVAIGDLPFYSEDLEAAGAPPVWIRFRDEVRSAAAVLFVTPEYNRSVPGALKNAIDVGSRPYGKSVFSKKPAAIISVSPGAIGGFGANHHLRQMTAFLDMPMLQQPEMYVGGASKLFDEKGGFASADTEALFKKFASAFADWIALNAKR